MTIYAAYYGSDEVRFYHFQNEKAYTMFRNNVRSDDSIGPEISKESFVIFEKEDINPEILKMLDDKLITIKDLLEEDFEKLMFDLYIDEILYDENDNETWTVSKEMYVKYNME